MMKKLLSLSVLIAMFAFISCTEVRDSAGNDENSSAMPEETTYTVTFFANDGTNKSYTQTFVSGESQLLNENCFTRTGYNFAGWNTKRNGYGTSYPDRARLTATYDIILYAQWTYVGGQDNPDNPVKTYTVTFNSNDGTNKSYTQTFVSGQSQNLNVNCFVRNGYTFVCWNTSSDGYGSSYADKRAITIYSDKTLYAQWTYIGNEDEPDPNPNPNPNPDNPVKTYTVTFYSNDGTDKSYTQTFINGQSQYLNANSFVRNGYTFAGWNTNAGGYGTSYTDKKAITIYSDKILYAQWTYIGNEEEPDPNPNPNPNPDNPVQTYTVTFYSNDETDKSYTQTLVSGQAQYLNANCFTRTGYTFAGWNTEADGYGTSYNDTGLLWAEEIISDMALYAIWEINTYTVIFDANGGSGEMYNQAFTYGESEKLIPNTFYRTDYKFVGWATTPNGNAVCTDEMAVLNLSTQANDEVTLYAVWTENIYTVVFDANGGNGEMSDISLTYDVAEQLPANTFYRTGYTFVGWAVTPNGSVFYTDEEDVLNITTKDKTAMTLYAKWLELYTITYELNGGTNAYSNPINYTVETDTITLANATRTGYTFVGWYTDEACTIAKTEITKGTTGNITLYAQWTANKVGISVMLPEYNDAEINLQQVTNKNTVTFTAADGFDSYGWYIDGVKQSETSATFAIDTSNMNPIIYKIMVIVSSGDEYYSATADLEIRTN